MVKIDSKDKALAALNFFLYKFEWLSNYSFFQEGIRISFHWREGESHRYDYQSPSEEQVDAVLLHLRFLFVNNEPSSYIYFQKCLNLIGPPADFQAELTKLMGELEAWKEQTSNHLVVKNGDAFNALLYGRRLHHNRPELIKAYENLVECPLIGPIELPLMCIVIREYWVFMGKFAGFVKRLLAEVA